MNERIRELIKQSYDELNEPNHDPVAREWLMKDLLPEYQRFAELIVEECRPWLADDAFEEVKRHFGVEE